MRGRRSFALLSVVILVAAPLASATAGELEVRLARPVVAGDTRPYVPYYGFFTATSDEALLTLSRLVDDCPAPSESCTSDGQCTSGSCRQGLCRYPDSVRIASVQVIRRARFCSLAACGPAPLPPECTGVVCDGSSSCAGSATNLNALCLCSSCYDVDPSLPPLDLPFATTFPDAVDLSWVLSQAAIESFGAGYNWLRLTRPTYDGAGTLLSPWVGFAQTRIFGLQPGENYVLVVKWTHWPYPGSVACTGPSQLSLHLETTASVCAP